MNDLVLPGVTMLKQPTLSAGKLLYFTKNEARFFMRCIACKTKVSKDATYCSQCGVVFEKHLITHSPIDHGVYFFSPRYLWFLFFSFKGRLNRERYITAHFFIMSCFLIYFAGCIAFAIYWGRHTQSVPRGFVALWISVLAGAVISYLFTIPIKIKRAHDIDHSGYIYWVWFIPGISLFTALWLAFKVGTHGVNRHGLCPRGKNEEHTKEPIQP